MICVGTFREVVGPIYECCRCHERTYEDEEMYETENPITESTKQLYSDVLTLALRLLAEDPHTFSPETAEVMDRWRSRCLDMITTYYCKDK